jgi:hypothetical protein
MRQRQQPG